MLAIFLFMTLAGVQATPGPAASEGPYYVEDPFAIESESPSAPVPVSEPTPAEGEPAPPPSGERVICRSKLRVGSRLVRERTCLTADQWRIYESDMEQSRRDIADRGARGCDMDRAVDPC